MCIIIKKLCNYNKFLGPKYTTFLYGQKKTKFDTVFN
jgi:hypothetical protein